MVVTRNLNALVGNYLNRDRTILSKNNLDIFCLSIFLGLGAFASPARAQPISHLKLDPNRAVWPRLSFHTPYLWVMVSTDIQWYLMTSHGTKKQARNFVLPRRMNGYHRRLLSV
jgi:hypothetical protein